MINHVAGIPTNPGAQLPGTSPVASLARGAYDDAGATPATATPLTFGVPFQRVAERLDDIDVFKVEVIAGDWYLFNIAPPEPLGSMPSLQVSYPGGALAELTSIYDDSPGTMGYFQAASTGTAYLTLSGGSPGTFVFTARHGGRDDHGHTYETAQTIGPGDTPAVSNYFADSDGFRVKLEVGTVYDFEMLGKAAGGGTIDLPMGVAINLSPAPGDGWGWHEWPSGSTRLTMTPTTSGGYYLEVGARNFEIGSYTLRMTSSAPGTQPATPPPPADTTAPLLISSSHVSGSTGVGLYDKFAFTFNELVTYGQVYGQSLTVTDDVGTEVQLNYVYAAAPTFTIDPLSFLLPGVTYTIDFGARGIVDYSGNPYSARAPFTFTTAVGSRQSAVQSAAVATTSWPVPERG